jgi:protein-tyrosine phosphatase
MDANLSSLLDEALANAVEVESFRVDPIVARMRTVRARRKNVVCSCDCGYERCGHIKIDPKLK